MAVLIAILLFNPLTLSWVANWYVVDDGWRQADVVVALRGNPEEQRLRTEHAADLLMKNYAPILVVDVYAKPVFGERQAELVQRYLEKRSVLAARMRVCENAADSTAEEADALRRCFL